MLAVQSDPVRSWTRNRPSAPRAIDSRKLSGIVTVVPAATAAETASVRTTLAATMPAVLGRDSPAGPEARRTRQPPHGELEDRTEQARRGVVAE